MRKVLIVGAVMGAALVPVLASSPAGAGGTLVVIDITTTADGLDGPLNGTSLREAIGVADGDGNPNQIVLPPGEYVLDRCAAPGQEDEDLNVNGDLDHSTGDPVTLVRSPSADGRASIHQTCTGERLLDSVGGRVTLQDVELIGGNPDGDGGAVQAASPLTLTRSTLSSNRSGASGGAISASQEVLLTESEVVDSDAEERGGGISLVDGGDLTASQSTVGRNDAQTGAGIYAESGSSVLLLDSTVAENVAHGTGIDAGVGGIFATDAVTAIQATIADNEGAAGSAANVVAAGLAAAETVIADASPIDSCFFFGAGATSGGYNYEQGGSTCGLTSGTGDVVNGADPGLLPLFANGGETDTAYFLEESPLLDRAPFPAATQCADGGTDQRGVDRPQGGACDTGALEIPPCGAIFGDVSADHAFCWEIGWMSAAGITTGFAGAPPAYRPSSPVTRQSMSAFLYRLAGSPEFEDPPAATFSDVSTGSTFFTEIEWMASRNITTGFPGGLYKPSQAVTRQAMSAFMYRFVAGSQEPVEPPVPTFADVGAGHPFYGEIEWMAEAGITTGFPGSPPTYRPGEPVTRQSMSAFMFRLAPVLSTIT
jgi:predicted outer membrane repeat protein